MQTRIVLVTAATAVAYAFALLGLAAIVIGSIVGIAGAHPHNDVLKVQSTCFPWETALKSAYEDNGELPAYMAVSAIGPVLLITVNPKTRTYTAFSQPNPDVMCVVDLGKAWDAAPQEVIDGVLDMVGDPT